MTTKHPRLLPLSDIPGAAARRAEREARALYSSRGAALEAASFEVVEAPGCYGGARPRTFGWLCSRVAAAAVSEETVSLPGSVHCPRMVRGFKIDADA